MKKLALLLLALPLAACATPTPQQNSEQVPPNSLIGRDYVQIHRPLSKVAMGWIAKATSHCLALDVSPSDPHYGQCVNDYLRYHYGVAFLRNSDGSLRVAVYDPWISPTPSFGPQL